MPEPAAPPGASAASARAPSATAPGAGAAGAGAAGIGAARARAAGAGAVGGTPSSVAETTRYLERIAELNPALGAVITVGPDALDEPAARDAQPRPGPCTASPS